MLLAHQHVRQDICPRTLAFVHGFTQTRKSMISLIEAIDIDSTYSAIAVDAPMHGESQHIETNISDSANSLVATCGDAVYLGYSMGARICLHAALQRPLQVLGLVLISGTAGILDPRERLLRQTSDNELALHIEHVGTKQFIDEWLARPMFASLPKDPDAIAQRCTNAATSLAKSLRLCGTGTQESLWDILSTLTMPVLLIAGANDDAFCQHARSMQDLIGSNATLEIVPKAGHSVHLEQPLVTAQIISRWLRTF